MDENLNEEEKEKLRLENEIRKIKLELEKGAKFIEGPDMPSLPPEIENEFLNYVEQFEQMNENSPKISIYEMLGRPAFKTASELEDEELDTELDRIFKLLSDNDIRVDSVHEVDDREMYRFLTVDIFEYEVYVMNKPGGMMTQFTYEEFYPDDVKDVVAHMHDFFDAFLDPEDEENRFRYEVEHLEDRNKWLYGFRESYNKFELHEMNVSEVQVHDDEQLDAEAVFSISLDAYTVGLTEKHVYKGYGQAKLRFTPGGWMIQSISFPKAL